ncbi:putative lipoprotein [Burkholderia mallei]|nr:putative lipoprotein [Burkholderia mallei]KOT11385.1 putative lipoprotein [Burkholderia mallei]
MFWKERMATTLCEVVRGCQSSGHSVGCSAAPLGRRGGAPPERPVGRPGRLQRAPPSSPRGDTAARFEYTWNSQTARKPSRR